MTSPAPIALLAARDTFLDAVRAAELLTPNQIARVEALVPHELETAAEAARALVAAGFLTKFQAERLLAGRTDGFRLGPYLIQEQVGRSYMGRVYKAKHRTMNRSVAIKVLSADLTRTAAARQALQREVRAAAQLNHPNIVTAYDANELADRHYLILEFVDGPNLETLVRERGPLPVVEACELVRQVALGLAHAHAAGMVHRHISPTNLLVARSPTNSGHIVKIADFGIAKLAPELAPVAETFPGNPDFVAPEQAHNPLAADHRADLYSLGAVLYFLLVGQPPFPGGTTEEKLRRHTWNEPVRIERLRVDVHPAVAALIHQLLAKHPQARPSSAVKVAERLDGMFGAAAHAVNFELPSTNSGPYSFISGQLSGGHPLLTAEAVIELSGRHVDPNSGVHPAPTNTASNSPWEHLAEDDEEDTPTPIHTPRRRTRSRSSIWRMSGLLAGMLLVCVAVAGAVMKVMAK
jgi:serine/threonine protein kinase